MTRHRDCSDCRFEAEDVTGCSIKPLHDLLLGGMSPYWLAEVDASLAPHCESSPDLHPEVAPGTLSDFPQVDAIRKGQICMQVLLGLQLDSHYSFSLLFSLAKLAYHFLHNKWHSLGPRT